jgi:thiamine biosynthesis protein ThiS
MKITLNGDAHELPEPVTVAALLQTLEIDSRRVAVEVNLSVVKKTAYETLVIGDGDEVEVVNFVGGG